MFMRSRHKGSKTSTASKNKKKKFTFFCKCVKIRNVFLFIAIRRLGTEAVNGIFILWTFLEAPDVFICVAGASGKLRLHRRDERW